MLSGSLKWSAYKASSLFVLPSHSEGLSVSVLEAMGLGIPVLVTTACHMPEAAANGCGWEVKPAQPELTTALLQFLESSPAELQTMGQKGQNLIRNQFSWPVIGRKMASVYEYALGGAEPAGVQFRPAIG